MHLQTLFFALIGVAILVLITVRQLRWQPVTPGKLVRMPVILALGGGVSLISVTKQLPVGWHLGGRDLAAIGIELVVAIGAGWALAQLTEFRTVDSATLDSVILSRLRPPGVVVWVGFLAVRVSLGLAAAGWGAPLAGVPATVLLVVALVKATQGALIWQRVERHRGEQPQLSPAPTERGRTPSRSSF